MIEIKNLTKSFGEREVLRDISLTVERGEILAVVGPSGAGKSTLSRCINLLERPTSGTVRVDGVDLSSLPDDRLREARRTIGTIFQDAPLLRRRTVRRNVALPLEYIGATTESTRSRVEGLLEQVGLANRADDFPAQLSGGQRQRVGIARALALKPSILLADEATSGLDPATTRSILELLKRLRASLNLSIILITHEMDVVREVADSVARIADGRIREQGRVADIILQPGSELARELLPERPTVRASANTRVWEVTYASDHVPSSWITHVVRSLPNADLELLGASVESIRGIAVGRVLLGSDDLNTEALASALQVHGLDIREVRHDELTHAPLETVSAA